VFVAGVVTTKRALRATPEECEVDILAIIEEFGYPWDKAHHNLKHVQVSYLLTSSCSKSRCTHLLLRMCQQKEIS
jgi:hypothetical protein